MEASRGEAKELPFIALAETLKAVEIPVQLLKDLLTAYRMDVTQKRYANFDEVLFYCKHSANPVGRLVLHIFGYKQESLYLLSDNICSALQLANFWQDVAVDFAKDRIYIPQDLMQKHGVTEEQLRAQDAGENFQNLLRECSRKTAALFNAGLPLCAQVGRDLKLEMRLTWLGGTTILKKLAENRYDPFRRRPVLSFTDKLSLLGRALWPQNLESL